MRQKGQVALMVLLVSAVIMTLGLSLSRRAVVETKIDTDAALMKDAFNAAESGIDYYIGTGSTSYTQSDGSLAAVTTQTLGSGATIDYGELTPPNDSIPFWFCAHAADDSVILNKDITSGGYNGNNITLNVKSGFSGSVTLDYYYYNLATSAIKVYRWTYNFGSGGVINNADSGTNTINLTSNLPPLAANRPLLLNVTPRGSSGRFYVSGDGSPFPSQGEIITSLGKAGDVNGKSVNQQVSVARKYKIPMFLIYALSAEKSILSTIQ